MKRCPDEIAVFFRDDDVGPLSEPLRAVMALLLEESVACSYQVVPMRLTAESASHARRLKQAHGPLVYFHQHGLRHRQEVRGRTRWSEFAAGRPYQQQRADIREGRRRLEDGLAEALDPHVFTPPCHQYDTTTLRVLEETGFRTLSAGVRVGPAARAYYGLGRWLGRVSLLGGHVSYHGASPPGTRLTEISVCIDVDEAVDRLGRKLVKDADRLWLEFEACAARLASVGVMLHHERYAEDGRLETLRRFVRRLKRDPRVRMVALPDLAAAPPARCATPAATSPRRR